MVLSASITIFLAKKCLSWQALYLLLVTNKSSNILEDLETLRLLSKVLPEFVAPPVDEESVGLAAFHLIFAFDEVISLGYKENVTVGQVKQNTEMESHEEKLHKMIIASKVSDTKVRFPSAPFPLPMISSIRWFLHCLMQQKGMRIMGLHPFRGYEPPSKLCIILS